MSALDGVGYVPFLPFGLKRLTYRLPKPETPILVTVGDHVRARRKVLGVAQHEAAKAIGVNRDTLARWETEPREPDRRIMPSIICFLGYDPQPPAQTFGALIRRTRRTLGLNQPGVAKALGVPTPLL
jgi:DNA-binding XRE family transcriptional regulator